MKLELTVNFGGDWILKHRNDDVLPIDRTVAILCGLFPTAKIVDTSFVSATIAADTELDESGATAAVNGKLVDEYGSALDDSGVAVTARVLTDEQFDVIGGEAATGESAATVAFGMSQAQESERAETQAEPHPVPHGGAYSRFFGNGQDAERADGESKRSSVDEILGEVDRLAGSSEFKALCHEIAEVAPVLIKNKTTDAFVSRCYLFVVNDGCGLSDDLALLARLIDATGIKKMATARPVVECALGPAKEDDEPFESVVRMLKMAEMSAAGQILSIDISEWLNSTDSRYFKNFLKQLSKQSMMIPVFNVPYVDKYVQDRLYKSLNDILFVRSVVVPPYTRDELEQYAERTFAHYGYTLTKAAWQAFFARIDDERADGRFYGLDTVVKVVKELVYAKQLYDVKHKNQTDAEARRINGKAAEPICAGIDTSEYGVQSLKRLVGSERIEQRVNEIVAQIELAVKSGKERPCIHMQFVGNPGTGKTTVARIVGKILKERGILSVGNFFEHSGRDFCGRYIGETAPKTSGMCRDAYGSVMFIDEAYSLYRGDGNDRDFGREALDTLIAEMENHRSDFVVIMAGYTDDMKKMMEGNAGLASRMPYTVEFPNFDKEQLFEIFKSMSSKFDCDADMYADAQNYFNAIPDDVLASKEFSNARFVRNLFERTWAKASMRCQLNGLSKVVMTKNDFTSAINDGEFKFDTQKKNRIGFGVAAE